MLLATAFAAALSQLPSDKVLHCWAPLSDAYTKIHATAAQQLERLFPNKQVHVPDATEDDPSSDVEDDFDDFDTDEALAAQEAEYERVAAAADNAGVPTRRSGRAGAAAATAAMNATRAGREREPLPTD